MCRKRSEELIVQVTSPKFTLRPASAQQCLVALTNCLSLVVQLLPSLNPVPAAPHVSGRCRWDAQFADLVLQLAHYFQGQDPETILLYIDVFSDRQGHNPVDHPLHTGPPAALLGGAKRQALQPVAEGEGEAGDTAEALQPSQEVVEEAARQRAATFAHLEVCYGSKMWEVLHREPAMCSCGV